MRKPSKSESKIEDNLVLRPFPQSTEGEHLLSDLWTKYREDMIDYAGIALFLFGNKKSDNGIVLSNGMREEFEIAKEKGLLLLPIGSTGYMAKQLWTELNSEIQNNSNLSTSIKDFYLKLGSDEFDAENLIKLIIELITLKGAPQ